MPDLKEILSLPMEHRQIVQEVMGLSIINDLKLDVMGPEQKKIVETRLQEYCKKSGAVFKYEDLKAFIIDKFK